MLSLIVLSAVACWSVVLAASPGHRHFLLNSCLASAALYCNQDINLKGNDKIPLIVVVCASVVIQLFIVLK